VLVDERQLWEVLTVEGPSTGNDVSARSTEGGRAGVSNNQGGHVAGQGMNVRRPPACKEKDIEGHWSSR